ncbi:MAG: EamA family transporter [Chloroflexi bacterium]|nr:EamA family transporter [Chloroflexota bacterium]
MPMRTSGVKLWAAMATLYVVWGSTYLGIAVAIETIPPFLMLAFRFAIAGSILLVWEIVRGDLLRSRPTRRQVRDAAVVGALLLGIGNGFVAYGQQTVASGVAAVLIALMPAWLAVFGWVYFRERLPRIVLAGIALGLAGVTLLVWPAGGVAFDILGIGALLLSPIGWGHGSLFSAHSADLPRRPLTSTAVQMLAGSVALFVEGALTGELGRFDAAAISADSVWAMVYLIFIGSLLAFNAYAWLLRNAPLSLIGTYAYVNPVVAFALGAVFLSEPITLRTVLASAVIVVSVAMIVTARGRAGRATVSVDPEEAVGIETGAAPGFSSASDPRPRSSG